MYVVHAVEFLMTKSFQEIDAEVSVELSVFDSLFVAGAAPYTNAVHAWW